MVDSGALNKSSFTTSRRTRSQLLKATQAASWVEQLKSNETENLANLSNIPGQVDGILELSSIPGQMDGMALTFTDSSDSHMPVSSEDSESGCDENNESDENGEGNNAWASQVPHRTWPTMTSRLT